MSEAAVGISREEVAHLARLSRLAVTDEELDRFAGQLDVILQCGRPGRRGRRGRHPADVALGAADQRAPRRRRRARPDPRGGARRRARRAEDGRFRVPRILDEEA